MSFFEELKRRNVFRVGIAYLVVGDPFLDSIRDDPRFAAIETRLGINRE